MNSVGDLATFYLTSTTMWLLLRIMNILMWFPGSLTVSRSTGTASWMLWYGRSIMVRVTYMNRLLMMGVTWIFSYMRVRKRRTCYSRILLSLTSDPRKVLSSILSKSSSSTNYRVERLISGTKLSISVWGFLRRPQQDFTICTPWIRQLLATKSEKGRGRKQWVLNNTIR